MLPGLQDAETGTWTRNVKITLSNLAQERIGCHVATDLRDDEGALLFDGRERLYDVTCLKYDRDGYLKRAMLVAECEWGSPNTIYYDCRSLHLPFVISNRQCTTSPQR